MDGYRHLSFAERKDIMARWKGHEGISQIARELGRDKSTVSRVIRRNGRRGPSGRRYRASTAQGRADERRLRCRRPRLMDDPERRALVVGPTRDEHWSPDQISGRIAMERPDLAVSGESVYRAVHSGALDCELPGRRKASTLLRHHGKRRRGKGFWERRGKVRITHDISERPEEASSRRRIGDWEGDTVAGRQGALGAPDCFCRPYHPWERGTNENTNGLLRDWFPKGASLDAVTDDEVQRVYDSLNRRPRKRLGRKCPWEVYHRQSLHLP